MNSGEELYQWFENETKQALPELVLTLEPTVTPGVSLGRVATNPNTTKPIIKLDVRPEGVRLNFPVSWGDTLSDWLGTPPAEAYRLKSNWVNQPSIGVAVADFDPYFKDLVHKVIELLQTKI